MAVFLGIDIGTSGTKTLAINPRGKILAQASAEYPIYHPKPLWSEQDPDDWWNATVKTIRAVVKFGRSEILLVTSLAICFAMVWAAHRAGYSVALGAFVGGMLIAESGKAHEVDELVRPFRDLFQHGEPCPRVDSPWSADPCARCCRGCTDDDAGRHPVPLGAGAAHRDSGGLSRLSDVPR